MEIQKDQEESCLWGKETTNTFLEKVKIEALTTHLQGTQKRLRLRIKLLRFKNEKNISVNVDTYAV